MATRILIPLAILLAGFGAWHWLGTPVEEPKPVHSPRQKLKSERLVLQPVDYQVMLKTQGTVRAHHSTTLTPLVSGTVVKVHPHFEDGAFFNKGDILMELDPADLQAEVTAAESRLARAEASLAREQAQAKQAKLNWEDIGYDEEPSPLVLRIPQLKEANALVTAAKAELEQAKRNLERSKVRAPFDGRVKERRIGLGQAVNATTPLGEVFATDHAEVRLPLAPSQLAFISLPNEQDGEFTEVTLTDALGNSEQEWHAKVVRTEGTLDEKSRELFAIARIEDPYGRVSGQPELRIGQPVRALVKGITLKDVFVIPREAVRGINRIYLIDRVDPKIVRTTIEPIWSNDEVLIVKDGLQHGDWLATSTLPYAPNGAPVQIVEPVIAAEEAADNPDAKHTGGS